MRTKVQKKSYLCKSLRKKLNFFLIIVSFHLFSSDENLHRCAIKVPPTTQLVLKEASIWFFYILRQIGKENKSRDLGIWQLCTVFDFNVLTLNRWWWIVLYEWQEFIIQLCGRHFFVLIFVDL